MSNAPMPHVPPSFGDDYWLQQSPININRTYYTPDLPSITVAYPSQLTGVLVAEDNLFVDAGQSAGVEFDGVFCPLLKLHFHDRSEHLIDGQDADLEAHFVHRIPNYPDASPSSLLVIGAFLDLPSIPLPRKGKRGAAATAVSLTQLEFVRKILGAGKQPEPGARITFDPNLFVPQSSPLAYYRYEGSLTTAPYAELVSWVVLRDHRPLDNPSQDPIHSQTDHSARVVEPLNRRFVLRNFEV